MAIAALFGFLLAIYTVRPNLLAAVAGRLGQNSAWPAKVMLGLTLAGLLPLVAGLSYTMTGATWVTEVLGHHASWYWIWVASAFTTGITLGLLLRNTEE